MISHHQSRLKNQSVLRHLIWDLGYGYAASEREWLVRAGLAGSIVLTVLLWIIGLMVIR